MLNDKCQIKCRKWVRIFLYFFVCLVATFSPRHALTHELLAAHSERKGLCSRHAQKHVCLPCCCETIHKTQWSLPKRQKFSPKRKYALIFVIRRSRCSFLKNYLRSIPPDSEKYSFTRLSDPMTSVKLSVGPPT